MLSEAINVPLIEQMHMPPLPTPLHIVKTVMPAKGLLQMQSPSLGGQLGIINNDTWHPRVTCQSISWTQGPVRPGPEWRWLVQALLVVMALTVETAVPGLDTGRPRFQFGGRWLGCSPPPKFVPITIKLGPPGDPTASQAGRMLRQIVYQPTGALRVL